jgi:hypothetical protein
MGVKRKAYRIFVGKKLKEIYHLQYLGVMGEKFKVFSKERLKSFEYFSV